MRPAVALALAFAISPSLAVAQHDSLPSARSIVDRYVTAIGGAAALRSARSVHVKGTLSFAGLDGAGDFELFAAPPNKSMMIESVPGYGATRAGYDGKTAWTVDPMRGPGILTGRELDEAREQADFYHNLYPADRFTTLETVGKMDVNGAPAWKLHLVTKAGIESWELFDVKTGLLVASERQTQSPVGLITVSTQFGDYRKFGKLLRPATTTVSAGPQTLTIAIQQVEYGTVPDSVFAVPEEVQALTR